MQRETWAFLLNSQQRVIHEYSNVLARWPDMPEGERAVIVGRVRHAKEQLSAFEFLSREQGSRL